MSDQHNRILAGMRRGIDQTQAKERPLASGGTAFPSGPPTGMRFFRSDLGFECYYDGTRWLTVHEYVLPLVLSVATAIAASANLVGVAKIRTDYAPYVTRVAYDDIVVTTNDGTKNWTISIVGYNAGFGAASTIDTFTTATQTPTTWTATERAPNISATPANAVNISLDVAKNSTPGNLQVLATMYHRLIVP